MLALKYSVIDSTVSREDGIPTDNGSPARKTSARKRSKISQEEYTIDSDSDYDSETFGGLSFLDDLGPVSPHISSQDVAERVKQNNKQGCASQKSRAKPKAKLATPFV